MSLLNDVQSLLAHVRETRKREAEEANATPRSSTFCNPWELQRTNLIIEVRECQVCGNKEETSQGLFEVFKHKKRDIEWKTVLEYSSIQQLTLSPPEYLPSVKINGCVSCCGHKENLQ